jgi:hypothetical protein
MGPVPMWAYWSNKDNRFYDVFPSEGQVKMCDPCHYKYAEKRGEGKVVPVIVTPMYVKIDVNNPDVKKMDGGPPELYCYHQDNLLVVMQPCVLGEGIDVMKIVDIKMVKED